MSDLKSDAAFVDKPVARGVAGKPISETPALEGAKRGKIRCDVNVDSLAYWNDPTGDKDQNFKSPFRAEVYVGVWFCCMWYFRWAQNVSLFSAIGWGEVLDVHSRQRRLEQRQVSLPCESWKHSLCCSLSNIVWSILRMSMEIIFIIAAATGRTLVLPPKEPLYRLRVSLGLSFTFKISPATLSHPHLFVPSFRLMPRIFTVVLPIFLISVPLNLPNDWTQFPWKILSRWKVESTDVSPFQKNRDKMSPIVLIIATNAKWVRPGVDILNSIWRM